MLIWRASYRGSTDCTPSYLPTPPDIAYTVLQNSTTEVGDHNDPGFTLIFDYEFVEDFRDSSSGEVEEEDGEDDIDGGENQAAVEASIYMNQPLLPGSAAPPPSSQQEAGQQQTVEQQAGQELAGQQLNVRKKNNWGPKEYKRKNHILAIMVRIRMYVSVYTKSCMWEGSFPFNKTLELVIFGSLIWQMLLVLNVLQ